MPRGPRFLIENACYHVIVRGNKKNNVFLDDQDYEKYLELCLHYKNKFHFRCYVWSLMPNHVHLMVDPRNPKDLIKIMHGINLSYSIWYHEKYGTCGHLWQGRYKNYVIEKDTYFVNCLEYIENNPVRAKLCENPSNWKWSSSKYRKFGIQSKILNYPSFSLVNIKES